MAIDDHRYHLLDTEVKDHVKAGVYTTKSGAITKAKIYKKDGYVAWVEKRSNHLWQVIRSTKKFKSKRG